MEGRGEPAPVIGHDIGPFRLIVALSGPAHQR
jgi:hypothetical protein